MEIEKEERLEQIAKESAQKIAKAVREAWIAVTEMIVTLYETVTEIINTLHEKIKEIEEQNKIQRRWKKPPKDITRKSQVVLPKMHRSNIRSNI